jgi:membrane protease YdiL (CAAX protease family)
LTEPSGDLGGPPLGSLFSLSGRPAPGLYAGAWFLAFLGIGLLAVALAAAVSGNGFGAGLIAVGAFLAFFVGAFLASGYQAIVRRATRDPSRYRGPSPFLVFAAVFAATNAAGALVALVVPDATLDIGARALLSVGIVVPLYALLVWLLVVREGALSWHEMGWPKVGWLASAHLRSRALVNLGYGVAVASPIVLVTVLFGGVLAALLRVTPPELIPIPTTASDWLLDIVVAAILAPIGEELFFRGFAQTAWTRDLGWRRALVRTAIFFALVHAISTGGSDFSEGLRLAVVTVLTRLPVAFALGWVFARTGSIVASIGLHAGFNGLMLLLAALILAR